MTGPLAGARKEHAMANNSNLDEACSVLDYVTEGHHCISGVTCPCLPAVWYFEAEDAPHHKAIQHHAPIARVLGIEDGHP